MFNPVSHNPSIGHQPTQPEGSEHKLEAAYEHIKNSIESDTPPDSKMGRLDFAAMPGLVKWANQTYPGLALHYASNPFELAEKLANLVKRGETSARFVGNFASDQMHMCAFEYKHMKSGHSLIGMEPGSSNNGGPAMMAFRIEMALQQHLPDAKFAMLEVNQQSSEYDCGMFSLDYAVKMNKAVMAFEKLHDDNCADKLQGKNDSNIVPHTEVDKILPAIFMKHIQGNRRLAELLQARPELENTPVNKRNETLSQRVERHSASREAPSGVAKTRNESIVHQREKYVRRALNL
jgi:YopJ family protease